MTQYTTHITSLSPNPSYLPSNFKVINASKLFTGEYSLTVLVTVPR